MLRKVRLVSDYGEPEVLGKRVWPAGSGTTVLTRVRIRDDYLRKVNLYVVSKMD